MLPVDRQRGTAAGGKWGVSSQNASGHQTLDVNNIAGFVLHPQNADKNADKICVCVCRLLEVKKKSFPEFLSLSLSIQYILFQKPQWGYMKN